VPVVVGPVVLVPARERLALATAGAANAHTSEASAKRRVITHQTTRGEGGERRRV
jgi:hypothetical protein